MVFVKHTIRKSTNNLCPGDRWLVASIKAQHYSDADITDATADEVIAEGGTPPGENIMAFNGPVVVHGYSLRVFSDFFGVVHQGLSQSSDEYRYTDVSTNPVHGLGIQNAAADGGYETSRLNQSKDKSIKNLEYLDGYRWQPARSAIMDMLSITSLSMSDEEYGANFPKGLQLGKAHLQKKFTRKSYKKISKMTFKEVKKSGFVLLPNTPTEFMSFGIQNLQHSQSESNDNIDGWTHVDFNVWLSYDQM